MSYTAAGSKRYHAKLKQDAEGTAATWPRFVPCTVPPVRIATEGSLEDFAACLGIPFYGEVS